MGSVGNRGVRPAVYVTSELLAQPRGLRGRLYDVV